MKENLPMFGVLNYVFVAVTQFESLNDTILENSGWRRNSGN